MADDPDPTPGASASPAAPSVEEELAHLSATFITLPAGEIDAHIEQAIGRVADALGLDRAIVGQGDRERGEFRVTHQWARPGQGRLDLLAQAHFVPEEQAPWIAERLRERGVVTIDRLDALPPEGARDHAILRQLGIRSVAVLRLGVAGEALGWLAFVAVERERPWPAQALGPLRLAAEIVASALARKRADQAREQAEQALARAMAFERLIAELSATFMHVPPEGLDAHIVEALARVGEFLGADRGQVVQHVPAERVLTRTHSWVREGVPGTPVSEAEEAFPWFAARMFEARAPLAVTHLDDLPPEAARDRAAWERLGLRSGAAVPMVVNGAMVGVLGFGSVQREQRWSPELTARLRLVAEVVGSALARRQGEVALRAALADNERLRERLAAENVYLQAEVKEVQRFGDVVGQSRVLAATLAKVDQVAATEVPVLLLGETGTGKELLARAIHARSRRSQRPLIAVNCAALPSTLIESELFGYERGAFTGASQPKAGRFELADGGTLFLDEIGDLEPALQATLLRVLQEGEIQRLGSTATRKVSVRIIAATNRDLRQGMRDGRFRDDLWYRLSVFPIEVPPLRTRREDIPSLVWHFIRTRQRALGRAVEAVPEAAMAALQAYDWPGNIRELQNVIERALILSPGPALRVDEALGVLAAEPVAPGGPPVTDGLQEAERAHILRILRECRWRVEGPKQAAERLGLRPSTLRHRMRKFGLKRPAGPL